MTLLRPDFSTFLRHDALMTLLRGWAAARPDVVELRDLGRSWEGRSIPLVVATRRATGADAAKPAFWVDGNIHAGELLASSAVLHWLHHLLDADARGDARVARLLDTRAIYLCPRLNPDGAELALAERPRFIRSSTRPYPFDEPPVEGLTVQDVDGDGRVLLMRRKDPHGGWKAHPDEPRLLVPREPGEDGGTYWRVMPEGLLTDPDGVHVRVNRDREGLDLNRNFPTQWRQEFEQPGAGPFPTSEPEVRAVVEFVAAHPNIGAAVSFHTHSGVILRPPGTHDERDMTPEDLWLYQRLSGLGEKLTGYPSVSIWHDFRYHPKEVISGTQDWFYEHLGALFWTVELWAPNREAGIEGYDWIHWYREHPPDDDLKLLRWSDAQCGGRAHVDWYAFEHPQLGAVELGGWDRLNYWRNPPPHLREREVAKFTEWLLTLALALPKLEVVEARAERLGDAVAHASGDPVWRVRLVVGNAGWLPSHVTRRAVERKTVRGVVFEIARADIEPGPAADTTAPLALLQGRRRIESGEHLDGHAPKQSLQAFAPTRHATGDRAYVEWTLRAPAGTRLRLAATADRAGRVEAVVELR